MGGKRGRDEGDFMEEWVSEEGGVGEWSGE